MSLGAGTWRKVCEWQHGAPPLPLHKVGVEAGRFGDRMGEASILSPYGSRCYVYRVIT